MLSQCSLGLFFTLSVLSQCPQVLLYSDTALWITIRYTLHGDYVISVHKFILYSDSVYSLNVHRCTLYSDISISLGLHIMVTMPSQCSLCLHFMVTLPSQYWLGLQFMMPLPSQCSLDSCFMVTRPFLFTSLYFIVTDISMFIMFTLYSDIANYATAVSVFIRFIFHWQCILNIYRFTLQSDTAILLFSSFTLYSKIAR